MLKPRPPEVREDFLKDTDDRGGDQGFLVPWHLLQDIQRHHLLGWAYKDDLIFPSPRDTPQGILCKIPMGVDDGQAVAVPQVRGDEGLEEACLSAAGLADDVHMSSAIVTALDAEDAAVVTVLYLGEGVDVS